MRLITYYPLALVAGCLSGQEDPPPAEEPPDETPSRPGPEYEPAVEPGIDDPVGPPEWPEPSLPDELSPIP